MKVWKISPGRNAMYWDRAVQNKHIFIGWPKMGDLSRFESQEELVTYYQDQYEIDYNPIHNGFTLWAFSHLIEEGDVIVANKGGSAIVGIGVVTGKYQYQEGLGEYPNTIGVRWALMDEVPMPKKSFPIKTLSEISTEKMEVIRQAVHSHIFDGEVIWRDVFGNEPARQETDLEKGTDFLDEFEAYVKHRNYSFPLELLDRFVLSLASKPFLILSGISGTGKTKIAQLFAEFMTKKSVKPSPGSRADDTFEYRLQPYNFLYNRMIIPKTVEEQFDLGRQEIITMHFGHLSEEALLKSQNEGRVLRLGFRKAFVGWMKQHFKEGDTIYIRIEEEGRSWTFSKEPFQSKDSARSSSLPKQHAFLSVRPDWLDHRSVLGSYNPITETYQVTELLKVMLRAQRHSNDPFFVILDEMNLAKVEYYFSDILSCLESRRMGENNELMQESMVLHNESEETAQSLIFVDEDGTLYNIPSRIEIPQNLYIIGTVNVDETTYMFSPKVLDRAHVIECNHVDFASYRTMMTDQGEDQFQDQLTYEERVDWLSDYGHFHQNLYSRLFFSEQHRTKFQPLFALADALKDVMMNEGQSFGYRVFDEMFTFIRELTEFGGYDPKDAFDLAVLQKVLPKLHGNRAQMDGILRKLFEFCLYEQPEDEDESGRKRPSAKAIHEDFEGVYSAFRFPRCAQKVQAMYKQLERTGYCSFIQ